MAIWAVRITEIEKVLIEKEIQRIKKVESKGVHSQFDCDLIAKDRSERIAAALRLCGILEAAGYNSEN